MIIQKLSLKKYHLIIQKNNSKNKNKTKESSKSTLRGAPSPPKRRPESTPGRPLIDVNGLQISTWAPPGAVKDFFSAPEAPQGGSKRAPGTLWEQGRRPRAAQEPTGRHLGSNSDPPGVHFLRFSSIFCSSTPGPAECAKLLNNLYFDDTI